MAKCLCMDCEVHAVAGNKCPARQFMIERDAATARAEKAESMIERWKVVISYTCGHGGYILRCHDNMTDDEIMEEFSVAAQKGNLDVLERVLGITVVSK